MIGFCIAAAVQDDQHWELSGKMGETKSSLVSWAQAGLSDECDGLGTKANIRRNTSSCNTDLAKPQTGFIPPNLTARCWKTLTSTWQHQGKRGRTERFSGRRWAGKVWARPEWGRGILCHRPLCSRQAVCAEHHLYHRPQEGLLKIHWCNPGSGYPKLQQGVAGYSLKANGEALTWWLYKQPGHMVWQVFIYFKLQSHKIF